MKKIIIGVDVSKEKLSNCLLNQGQVLEEVDISNTLKSIDTFINKIEKEYQIDKSELLICAEYTGQYAYLLCCYCEERGIDLCLENPSQIKYRSGMQRGKNDKIDARKIAEYALRFQDELTLFSMPEKSIISLKQLVSERDLYVTDRYKGQLSDQKRFMSQDDYKRKSKRLKSLINELDIAIKEIEKQIMDIISQDEFLSNQQEILCSVEGVGERTSVKMIIETNGFRDFVDPKKFCCHAGVAPFAYTSGTSVHSRWKVSKRADKSIKALLHMSALSAATRCKGEMSHYYKRKVSEGKNKMSVLNAIRAKLVYRMFAVIKNNRFYEKNYQNPLCIS